MRPRELLVDTVDFLSPPKVLEGLRPEDAERRVPGAPHSIAELVAHMTHWQEWFLDRAAGNAVPAAEHASAGWPAVAAGTRPEWNARFQSGLERVARLSPEGRLDPVIEVPLLAHFDRRDVIVHVVQHNAHRLGQVILLRQLLQRWPPPAGSFTW